METFTFKELTTGQNQFFAILPKDWQDEIVPFWNDYNSTAKIYVIEAQDEIIGGGIVFAKSPPNFSYFEAEANSWFKKGFLYLGFIWIAEHKRNKNLGSFWLNELKAINPNQKFFLLTEEEHLQRFYEKNTFSLVNSIEVNGHEEWLYVYGKD